MMVAFPMTIHLWDKRKPKKQFGAMGIEIHRDWPCIQYELLLRCWRSMYMVLRGCKQHMDNGRHMDRLRRYRCMDDGNRHIHCSNTRDQLRLQARLQQQQKER